MQATWIGRSEGALVNFTLAHTGQPLPCFTTRPDTLWGVTFMSLAPEHPLVPELVAGTQYEDQVLDFAVRAEEQGDVARASETVEKEGLFTGRYVVNPVNGERVPLWVANYALMEYGTGAVMAVPAHDQRDFEFARKYGLPIRAVIRAPEGELDPDEMDMAYDGPGVMVNSGSFDGTPVPERMHEVIAHLERSGIGRGQVNYRLRDWLVSRQRYWGAPIPIVHCQQCGTVPVPEADLPVLLPEEVDFTPRGKSPLAFVEGFVRTRCPSCGGAAERETDTIAQWLCSCWYFLRYLSPHDHERPFDRDLVARWLPVDLYIGGVEHAVLHLLYSRFVVKVLYDAGWVGFVEPFTSLFTQGMICKQTYICKRCSKVVSDDPNVREPCSCDVGVDLKTRTEQQVEVTSRLEKMSKSKGNGVTFDEVIKQYGADTLRLYTLAIGPPEKDAEWQDSGIVGYSRFLNRFWDLVVAHEEDFRAIPRRDVAEADLDGDWLRVFRLVHATTKKVTQDIQERWHFNTAIASVIMLLNEVQKLPLAETYRTASVEDLARFAVLRFAAERMVLLLAPFVPHVCEELWTRMGNQPSVLRQPWPGYDEEAARTEEVELPVQVNGRLRGRLVVPRDEDEEVIREQVLALDNVRPHLEGKRIQEIIVVPNRIVNIVVL
jgi:leucyl-tRNA synthetase